MKLEIKTNHKVQQFRFEFNIPFIKKTFRTIWQFYRSPDTWTYGYTSRCEDGRHVLFLEYDRLDLNQITDEVKYLQEQYDLSHAYVFENDREKSYHIVMLDKFSLKEAYKIIEESNVEWSYLNSVRFCRGREWVLRTAEKGKRKAPKFHSVIKSKHQVRKISTAHKEFLQKYEGFNVPKLKYKFEDNIYTIPVVQYNTGNRVD